MPPPAPRRPRSARSTAPRRWPWPGDTVLVHEGVYREWVKPANGGLSDTRRITYAAAPGEHVEIKGAERVTGWDARVAARCGRSRSRTRCSATSTRTRDDRRRLGRPHDRGRAPQAPRRRLPQRAELLRGRRRATSSPPRARTEVSDDWTGRMMAGAATRSRRRFRLVRRGRAGLDHDLGRTSATPTPTWSSSRSTCAGRCSTRSWHHLDYITVRGFELAQAACPWTPPTADQPGLIGPNWAKGWIIEDNDIHDAKCSAISIGKEASTGDNNFTDAPRQARLPVPAGVGLRRPGRSAGARSTIGSHVIRNNHIHDCGQNGVVGHLGCVFSTIEDNHIYNIAIKREFFGHEIGGIKLHAAIDVEIAHNHIHDCTLGIWLDWQTQGTRVTRNVLHDNCRDLFVEVSHGPYVVDHNIFASNASIESVSEGGAYVGQPHRRHRPGGAGHGPRHAVPPRALARRSPATPSSTPATTASSATSSAVPEAIRGTSRRRTATPSRTSPGPATGRWRTTATRAPTTSTCRSSSPRSRVTSMRSCRSRTPS